MNRRRFLQALFAVPCLGAPLLVPTDPDVYWVHRVAEDMSIPCGDDWPLSRQPGDVFSHCPGSGGSILGGRREGWRWNGKPAAWERVCRTCFPALPGDGG